MSPTSSSTTGNPHPGPSHLASSLAEHFTGQGERVEVGTTLPPHRQVYIGNVDYEEENTEAVLETMVEKLKQNKYIR